MGLAPLACLAVLHLCGRRRERAWWVLAVALGVSWLADTAAHWMDPRMVSVVYPVSQAGIVGAVLLKRRDAEYFVTALVAVALVVVLARGVEARDWILHTFAWGGVTVMLMRHRALGRLSFALSLYFGLGAICWIAYATHPLAVTWYAYQISRALGLALFCWAAVTVTT